MEPKEKRKTSVRYAPELRERAVRMVLEHARDHASQWEAIGSIAGKIGCKAETLRGWVRQSERNRGLRPGSPGAGQARIKELERENRELQQASEILRKANDREAVFKKWCGILDLTEASAVSRYSHHAVGVVPRLRSISSHSFRKPGRVVAAK
jgi:transposase